MPTLRIATFNVENLFERAKVLNFHNNITGDKKLVRISELQDELAKTTYDKPAILKLYNELKEYITVVETREKLFDRSKKKVVVNGRNDWDGFISFKPEKFTEDARKNTAKVIRSVNADICCLIEVESRPVLKHFFADRLSSTGNFEKYSHLMLIDGNDTRGIDVALASRYRIKKIISHIDDKKSNKLIFSRDCLELEIESPYGTIWVLVNHFKSKGYGVQSVSNNKRLAQSEKVAEILQNYNLKNEMVVVAGDLNDTPGSAPLAPLLSTNNLYDVLEAKYPNKADRWSYHYKKNEQIDYLLVSKPLHNILSNSGVERKGIFKIEEYSNNTIKAFPTVKTYTDSASDHGMVWAEFSF